MMWDPDTIKYLSNGYLRGKFTTSLLKDLDRVYLIKKQLTKYKTKRQLNIRLLLNNIILLFNCFTPTVVKRLLEENLQTEYDKSIIKTCLIKISFMEPSEWPETDVNDEIEILLKQTIG